MRRQQAIMAVLIGLVSTAMAAAESSTIFRPSTYSHDPTTGKRVVQYARGQVAVMPVDPTYRRSGYVHNRYALRGIGGTAARQHVVETWGAGESIRPYGEWQRPYRAGATPYGPWGNPQGPYTSPYDSMQNPFALGRYYQPWWAQAPHPGYGGGTPGGGYPGTGPGGGYPGGGHPGTGHPGGGHPGTGPGGPTPTP